MKSVQKLVLVPFDVYQKLTKQEKSSDKNDLPLTRPDAAKIQDNRFTTPKVISERKPRRSQQKTISYAPPGIPYKSEKQYRTRKTKKSQKPKWIFEF